MAMHLIAETVFQAPAGELQVLDKIGLVIAESILLVVVLVVYPVLARAWLPPSAAPPRGLNLPQGSVRSMLALTSVGTLVVVATFGAHAFTADQYERVITVLSALAGPILGFYFGSRHAESRRGPATGPAPDRPADLAMSGTDPASTPTPTSG